MCILLGAITPDHKKKRIPLEHYYRYTNTERDRQIMSKYHGRKK